LNGCYGNRGTLTSHTSQLRHGTSHGDEIMFILFRNFIFISVANTFMGSKTNHKKLVQIEIFNGGHLENMQINHVPGVI